MVRDEDYLVCLYGSESLEDLLDLVLGGARVGSHLDRSNVVTGPGTWDTCLVWSFNKQRMLDGLDENRSRKKFNNL